MLWFLHIEKKGVIHVSAELHRHSAQTPVKMYIRRSKVCKAWSSKVPPVMCQSVNICLTVVSPCRVVTSLLNKSTFKWQQCLVGLRGKCLKLRHNKTYIFYSDINLTVGAKNRGWTDFPAVFVCCSAELELLFFRFESHTLYDTVQMCIKYKVYGLLHSSGKQYFSMTVFNWIEGGCDCFLRFCCGVDCFPKTAPMLMPPIIIKSKSQTRMYI